MLPYLLQGEITNVVGASGAVMGVMVAFAVAEPDREFFLFPFPWPVNARALVMMVFVMNLIYSLDGTSVSVLTHFGGMAIGFLYMKILPVVISMRRERRRKEVKSKKHPSDKVGEAVDNIFKFDDRKRR
jgi:membrane associated rhomboid family serine protease